MCVSCEENPDVKPRSDAEQSLAAVTPLPALGYERVEIRELDAQGQTHACERPRPTFEHIYMQLAFQFARRSTCTRLNVGTVITSTDYRKVLSVGYNGNASGLPNTCDRREPGNCGCLHSEENAVINCDAPRFLEKHVFVTHLPCVMCAKRLINLGGVKKVFFARDYRSRDSLALFESLGIAVAQVSEDVENEESSGRP